MFLSQGALQNILGRHGNPWQAATAWPASTLNFSEQLNTWMAFREFKGKQQPRMGDVAAAPCRQELGMFLSLPPALRESMLCFCGAQIR